MRILQTIVWAHIELYSAHYFLSGLKIVSRRIRLFICIDILREKHFQIKHAYKEIKMSVSFEFEMSKKISK